MEIWEHTNKPDDTHPMLTGDICATFVLTLVSFATPEAGGSRSQEADWESQEVQDTD